MLKKQYQKNKKTKKEIDFLEENIKKSEDKNIGFPERNIERSAPQAIAGINRFKSIAEKVIENYFNQNKNE